MEIRKFATPINLIIFQVCWFACVMGAAKNIGWLGPLLVTITVPLQIFLLTEKYRVEFLFVVFCGITGFLLETGMILGNVYMLSGPAGVKVCPPWMAALWFNFAMPVSISLSWLKGKYLLAAILGGLAGPVAYWGGEMLGAIMVADVFSRGYLVLVIVWTLVLPFLVHLHSRMTGPNSIS